jgi:WhiB family transcriptional regulator, redox-sensing transcriptional regulator
MPTPNPYRQVDRHAPDLTPPQALPWMDRALCAQVDPDLFFELSTSRYEMKAQAERVSAAKAVCAECPVKAECLELALANDERYGIWGGLTERERREVKRRRRTA